MFRSRSPLTETTIAASCAALGLLATAPAAHAQLSFTYTSFDPPLTAPAPVFGNVAQSEATGISASGNITGDYLDANSNVYGYIVQGGPNGTYITQNINYTGNGSVYNFMQGINNAGYATGIGQDANFSDVAGFIYNSNNGTYLAPTIAGTYLTEFNNINEQGLVATVYYNNQSDHDNFTNAHSAIYNMTTGTFTTIGDVAGFVNTSAQTVTASGGVLANLTSASGSVTGVLMQNGVNTFFSDPNGISTHADSISSNGQLIGGHYTDTDGNEHGFVYDRTGSQYYTTDFSTNASNPVTSVYNYHSNKDNSFVGTYFTQDGNEHSLLITASSAPEPSALALLAPGGISGVLLLARRRRRTQGDTHLAN